MGDKYSNVPAVLRSEDIFSQLVTLVSLPIDFSEEIRFVCCANVRKHNVWIE
jgi:hypothetical protein